MVIADSEDFRIATSILSRSTGDALHYCTAMT
jgi:hypothetical protein